MPQDQHYLPQSYQKGWADENGQVHAYYWVYDKLVCRPKSPRSTGAEPDMYSMPMAPAGSANFMEDEFWRLIDQWGADGLALLRSNDPTAAAKLNKPRFVAFLMSLLWRNPRDIARIEADAKKHVTSGTLAADYDTHRRPHEPATFEEFKAQLEQPGLSEFGAEVLRSYIRNDAIHRRILAMSWEVITVTNDIPLLTSDVPIILFKGLANPDGLLMLPLSPTEFFVAFNENDPDEIEMRASIDASIKSGHFVEAMNRYTVQHRHKYVYGKDVSQIDFVARYWEVLGKHV